jgi:hypothetical protein
LEGLIPTPISVTRLLLVFAVWCKEGTYVTLFEQIKYRIRTKPNMAKAKDVNKHVVNILLFQGLNIRLLQRSKKFNSNLSA